MSLLYCDIVVYGMPMRLLLSVELVSLHYILVVVVDFFQKAKECLGTL